MSDVLRILPDRFFRTMGLVFCLVLAGCDNEFEPNLESVSIPIVYGLINPDDSVYSISVSKTFLCDQSVTDCSKDSSVQYFKDVKVELEVLNAGGLLLNRAELYPVTVGRSVSPGGAFSSASKVVYSINRDEIMIDSHFDFGRTLILKISTPEYPKLVYAQAGLRLKFWLVNPPERVHGRWLDFYTEFNESVRWMGWPDDYYEVNLTLNYTDYYLNSTRQGSVKFSFSVPPKKNPGVSQEEFAYRIDGELFLRKLEKAFRSVGTPDSLDYRKFRTLDIQVVSSTHDYYNYIYALHHDSDVPVVQKFNIVNGIGIFATKREAWTTGHLLQWNVLDSLAGSEITRALKFVRWY